MTPPLTATRWAWFALIALQLAWFGGLAPEPSIGRPAACALAAGPLLAPLWWVWRLRPNGLVAGGLVLLVYFCVAVSEAWVDPVARTAALVQIGLIAVYFAALAGIRRRSG